VFEFNRSSWESSSRKVFQRCILQWDIKHKRIVELYILSKLTLHIQKEGCILADLQRGMLHDAEDPGVMMRPIDRR